MHRRSPKRRNAHVPIIPQRILQLVRRHEAVRRPEALSNRHFRVPADFRNTDYGKFKEKGEKRKECEENEWEKAGLSLFLFYGLSARDSISFCGELWRDGLVGLDHGSQDKCPVMEPVAAHVCALMNNFRCESFYRRVMIWGARQG